MKAVLLIDHGSRRDAANEMMNCMANLVQAMAGPNVVVRYAHMELAEPSIASGVPAALRLLSEPTTADRIAGASALVLLAIALTVSTGRRFSGYVTPWRQLTRLAVTRS